jgi:hypothetical protein
MTTTFMHNGTAYQTHVSYDAEERTIAIRNAITGKRLYALYTHCDVIMDAKKTDVDLSDQTMTDFLIDDFKQRIADGLQSA